MDTILPPVVTDAEVPHTTDRKSARRAAEEVIVRGERRRAWTIEQKREIVATSFEPGVMTADVARHHGIGTGPLYTCTQVELSQPVAEMAVAAPMEVLLQMAGRLR